MYSIRKATGCSGLVGTSPLGAAGSVEVPRILPDVARVDGVAAAQGVVQEIPRPGALVAGLPDGVAFQVGHGGDALRLAAAVAALGDALERLQRVEAEDLQVAPRGDQHLVELPAQGDLQLRQPPGHRQARAGHQRDLLRRRGLDHVGRLGPAVGEMLVDEDRHRAARGPEDVEHLAEVPAPRVELLELLVVGILAVLGDQQDGVDGQLAGAERQGVGDRRAEADPMPLGLGTAQVGRRRRPAR